MSVDTVLHDAMGRRVLVTGEVQDLVALVRLGAPRLGWEGDPDLEVGFDTITGLFEAWGTDLRGTPYRAAHAETVEGLIRALVRNDNRRGNVVESLIEEQTKAEAERDRAHDDHFAEVGDKLHWALTRDIGQHYGGNTRRLYVPGTPGWKDG